MPAYHPQRIEPKWQLEWERNKTFRAIDLDPSRPKLYVLDMFPYPSGAGLHVGHPEGYTATDIYCRYKRMRGFNVLHPMGWDAFGLPAEQYAVSTNTHPRITTQTNIDTFRRQIKSLGFSYDWDREIDTTDPDYYKWTQWIFLKIYDTWYDPEFEWTDWQGRTRKGKGRPIAELPIPPGTPDPEAYRDSKRLAYRALVPVNWCPELGTVLANEEVIDGKSERGGFPVIRMPLTQWMLRITAYAERLIEELEEVDWPRPIKDMQRNWVGRSVGAEVDFLIDDRQHSRHDGRRPAQLVRDAGPGRDPRLHDTPRHALRRNLHGARPRASAGRSAHDRGAEGRRRRLSRAGRAQERDGPHRAWPRPRPACSPAALPINPVNGESIPVWIADYVLMGVRNRRDHGRARSRRARLRVCPGVRPEDRPGGRAERRPGRAPLEEAEPEPGISVNSRNAEITLDGLPTAEAKTAITDWLEKRGLGKKTVNYKLRDWLFSRQRYWGEPFPVVFDENDRTHALSESRAAGRDCRSWRTSSRPASPSRRSSKATEWVRYSEKFERETNTMPQWAGSCWYYLRYLDPKNDKAAVGSREREVLDAGRPLYRRRRARRAAPALQPVLAQGALRPRARQHARAVSEAGQPGDDPGRDRVHRPSRRRGKLGFSRARATARA